MYHFHIIFLFDLRVDVGPVRDVVQLAECLCGMHKSLGDLIPNTA